MFAAGEDRYFFSVSFDATDISCGWLDSGADGLVSAGGSICAGVVSAPGNAKINSGALLCALPDSETADVAVDGGIVAISPRGAASPEGGTESIAIEIPKPSLSDVFG